MKREMTICLAEGNEIEVLITYVCLIEPCYQVEIDNPSTLVEESWEVEIKKIEVVIGGVEIDITKMVNKEQKEVIINYLINN